MGNCVSCGRPAGFGATICAHCRAKSKAPDPNARVGLNLRPPNRGDRQPDPPREDRPASTRRQLLRIEGNIWLSNSWKQELVITTDGVEGEVIVGIQRIKMTLPFDRIAQVNLARGPLAATLEVVNKGGSGNLVVKGLDKDEAERAKALIESKMREQTEASVPKPAQVSVADELRKLAALRDDGIISAAEFEAQKAKLLR